MIETIREGGMEYLIVVLGSCFDEIKNVINDREAVIIHNSKWFRGISTSICCGLKKTPDNYDSAIFFVVDQPFLSADHIKRFVNYYQSNQADILSTSVQEQLCHPVLFTRRIFPALMQLKGDQGGKYLFNRYGVERFHTKEDKLLWDIDSEDDLSRLE